MDYNTLILGAGAAGMMTAAHAGPGTLVIDHAKAPGEKIRISGGGRCNFTNMHCEPGNFISQNPHFAKSALARYTQWDFLDLIARHDIAWHEKTLGQLFCDTRATAIIDMLRDEMARAGAQLWLNTSLENVTKTDTGFTATLTRDGTPRTVTARNLVLATGGKSIPKMGATGLAYDIARQFGHTITETRPALVPFTFSDGRFTPLAGVATPVRATADTTSFDEAMLFTHRGLSGPAMLQISSYWREGDPITLNLLPSQNAYNTLRALRQTMGRKTMPTVLATLLPSRLAGHLCDTLSLTGNMADHSDTALQTLANALTAWILTPSGTEGYRTAEVTLGGIDTAKISSKTMQSTQTPGLYMIGECVDVTGWLGGFNFQWAWSSAMAAARAIAAAP